MEVLTTSLIQPACLHFFERLQCDYFSAMFYWTCKVETRYNSTENHTETNVLCKFKCGTWKGLWGVSNSPLYFLPQYFLLPSSWQPPYPAPFPASFSFSQPPEVVPRWELDILMLPMAYRQRKNRFSSMPNWIWTQMAFLGKIKRGCGIPSSQLGEQYKIILLRCLSVAITKGNKSSYNSTPPPKFCSSESLHEIKISAKRSNPDRYLEHRVKWLFCTALHWTRTNGVSLHITDIGHQPNIILYFPLPSFNDK